MSAQASWHRHFWRNAATNYLRTILRLLSGLVLFRLCFEQMPVEEFGFYALIWSLFGYTILLDFGLGFTVQKTVAGHSARGDFSGASRLLSTVFWSFAALALLLFVAALSLRGAFLDWTHVPEARREAFARAYLVFFSFLALGFPMGLFPEMLRGVQRLDLANWLQIGSLLLNFVLMAWALLGHWPFALIVLVSVGTTILPNFGAAFLVRRQLPGLSLHPRNFDFGSIRGVLSFSVVAYLITFTNLIMSRTDQAVISFGIGVAAVAIYQAGYKVAEMFGLFSVQMQDALTPAAAQLHAQADRGALLRLLEQSTQMTVALVTPLAGLCAVYLEPLIRVLTGLKQVDHQTMLTGWCLLAATWSSLVTNSCSKRILMMCGWEKKLLVASLVDALVNLILSVALVRSLGVVGVAVGTLVPTVLVGWLWIFPLTARFAEQGVFPMLRALYLPAWRPVCAGLGALALLAWLAPAAPDARLLALGWRGGLVGLATLLGAWPQLRALRSAKKGA
jgi:O-antigen/teichoic acid export membrane protein